MKDLEKAGKYKMIKKLLLFLGLIFSVQTWTESNEIVDSIKNYIVMSSILNMAATVNQSFQILRMKEGNSELTKEIPYRPGPTVFQSSDLVMDFYTSKKDFSSNFNEFKRVYSSFATHCHAIYSVARVSKEELNNGYDVNRFVFATVILPNELNTRIVDWDWFKETDKFLAQSDELVYQYQNWILATSGYIDDSIDVEDSDFYMESHKLCKEFTDSIPNEYQFFETIWD